MVLAIVIGVATIGLVIARPRRINEGVAALIGGGLVVATGLVPIPQAWTTLLAEWNVFIFFLGMMALSALAEEAGFFDWAASHAARLARGQVWRLLVCVMVLGVATSVLLSNDATALMLTPIVFTLVKRLKLDPIPFTFACAFIADTASFVLPVSNPINIIVLTSFQLSLGTFFQLLLLPSLLAIALNIVLFLLLFRSSLRGRFEPADLGNPDEAVRHAGFFRFVLIALGGVAVAYIVFSLLQWPLSLVALAGAGALLAGYLRYQVAPVARIARAISWPIFGFIAGMVLVVRAVENVGLAQAFGTALLHAGGAHRAGDAPTFTLVGVTVLGTAVGSNLINNIPMAVVMTAVLRHVTHVTQRVRLALLGATIVGCDLGPNLTTVGSLAKVFWLLMLRQRGLKVSSLDYLRVGIVVAPPMLLASAALLWLLVR